MKTNLLRLRQYLVNLKQNVFSLRRKLAIYYSIDKSQLTHLKKQVNCPQKWYGSTYGGFYINPKLLNKDSVVYSIGIGTDITFDRKCMARHSCQVFGFDPTPKAIRFIEIENVPPNFSFQPYGLASESGTRTFFLPANPKGTSGSLELNDSLDEGRHIEVTMKSLNDICEEEGHQKLDVLKMDIEGSEYDVIESVLNSGIEIDQILIEFHDRFRSEGQTDSRHVVSLLNDRGYKIFGVSLSYEEVSFIRNSILN
jgi:FkbM family methyltransferase